LNLILIRPAERHFAPHDPRAGHLRKVLRAGPGDSFRAGEIDGDYGSATITSWNKDGIDFTFAPGGTAEEPAEVDLILGHPRPIVLRRMIRDLCTVGVRRLMVVPTLLGEKSYLRSNMWEQVEVPLLEGASQAGTTRLMAVERLRSLEAALEAIPDNALRILLHPATSSSASARLLTLETVAGPAPVAVAVGSERGWTDSEVTRLTDAGFRSCALGTRILRTESAALIGAWIAVAGKRAG